MAAAVPLLVLHILTIVIIHAHAVNVFPDLPPAERTWNGTGNSANVTELPFDYIAEQPNGVVLTTMKTVPGCSPGQVSLGYFGVDGAGRASVLVSWATCDAILQSSSRSGDCTGPAKAGPVTRPLSTDGLVSRVYWGLDRGNATQLSNLAEGNATSYVYDYMDLIGFKYASPVFHHVLIKGLIRGRRYRYAIVDSVATASQDGSRNRPLLPRQLGPHPFMGSFRAPGQVAAPDNQQFPLHVAVVGDPGQTFNTTVTLTHVMRGWGLGSSPRRPWNRGGVHLLLLLGDLSYASESIRVSPATCNITPSEGFAGSYPPRWDSWKNLLQPLLSAIPSMSVPGNHELEFLPGGATYSNWTAMQMAYNARAPQATRGPLLQPSTAPITGRESGYANSYWLNRVPGVGTFIGITNYSPNDVNVSAPNMNGFSALNEQYVWLEQQLKAINRTAEPWVVVTFHSPWYITYTAHFKENECMRQLYEPLLVKYSVDIVFNGHVHAYERSKPVSDYTVDSTGCAPMYVAVGDAGNIEGPDNQFITANYVGKYLNCSDHLNYSFPPFQPQKCFSYQSGPGSGCAPNAQSCYCFASQPAWSAYREPSFGHGRLYLLNSTHARWQWMRNQDSHMRITDEIEIIRLPQCSA